MRSKLRRFRARPVTLRHRLGAVLTILAIAGPMVAGCAAPAPGGGSPTTAPRGDPTLPAYALAPSQSQLISRALAACMTDKGWNVRLGSDFGVSNVDPLPDSEMASYNDDIKACSPPDASSHTATAPSEPVLRRAWEREKQSWQCLHTAGYTLDEVPSLTVYLQTARVDKMYSTWQLLSSNPDVSPPEFSRLATVCPDPLQWFGE